MGEIDYLGAPISKRVVDVGLRNQCRCGGTKYVLWRKRYHCIRCGRFIIAPIQDKDKQG